MALRKAAAPVLEEASTRSIFVKVRPTPTSLGERRAALRAMQRYGKVEVFKRLREPSSFISVVATKSMVDDLVSRSPLEYEYITDKSNSGLLGGALREQHSTDITTPVEPIEISALADEKAKRSGNASPYKTFALHIFPTTTYKHRTVIRYSPLHGPWTRDRNAQNTFTYAALKDSIPDALDAEGLRDWESGGQLSDSSDQRTLSEELSKLTKIQDRKAKAVAGRREAAKLASILGTLRTAGLEPGKRSSQTSAEPERRSARPTMIQPREEG